LLCCFSESFEEENLSAGPRRCFTLSGHMTLLDKEDIFDTYAMDELGFFENSFLRNPEVPAENLKSQRVLLEYSESTTLKVLIKELAIGQDAPLLEVVFPKASPDKRGHSHFALTEMSDRATGGILWDVYSENITNSITYNEELLFAPWYTYWKNDLEKLNFTCLVTGDLKIDHAAKYLKVLSPSNSLYVVSNNPGEPTGPLLYTIKDHWAPWVVWGFDFLWAGHKILKEHTVIIQLQMEACAAAQHVVINTWEPVWLIEGICSIRNSAKTSECHMLMSII